MDTVRSSDSKVLPAKIDTWPAEMLEVRGFTPSELKARRRLDLATPPTT